MSDDKQLIEELRARIKKLEKDLGEKNKELELLTKKFIELQTNYFSVSKQVGLLQRQNEDLEKRYEQLSIENQELKVQINRPKLSGEHIMASMQAALVKMEEGLKTQASRVDYTLSGLNMKLKTAAYIDPDNNFYFQLPTLGEAVTAENLSEMEFTIKGLPKAGEISITVPNVIGLEKEQAVETLKKSALKPSIVEKISNSRPGLVIAQDPEPYCEAEEGTAITVAIAVAETVKVPNLLGTTKAAAIKLLEASQLELGEISHRLTEMETDLVFSQNPVPGTELAIGGAVDIELSIKGAVVPRLIGKTEAAAVKLINESQLTIGEIDRKPRLFGGLVIAQEPEAAKTVPVDSAVDLEISIKWTSKEIEAALDKIPASRRFGLNAVHVIAAIEKYGINNSATFGKFLSVPNRKIQLDLGIRSMRRIEALKEFLKKAAKD